MATSFLASLDLKVISYTIQPLFFNLIKFVFKIGTCEKVDFRQMLFGLYMGVVDDGGIKINVN